MLNILRRIVEEVNAAQGLEQVLALIVNRVKANMAVDVCSIYLWDHKSHYILMATDGLHLQSVGSVRLQHNQGLVGLVAGREETVNLHNATENPSYVYFPETGEEQYPSFLGVPIIHKRSVLGVLVVQRHEPRKFDTDQEAFLITVAAQLASVIAHAEAVGDSIVLGNLSLAAGKPIYGLAGAPGVAFGNAVVVYPPADLDAVPDRQITDTQAEQLVFIDAVSSVRDDLQKLTDNLRQVLSAEERALFDAYQLMLGSDALVENTLARIREGNWASGALRKTIEDYVHAFDNVQDAYIKERVEDVRDLGRRILSYLQKSGRSGYQFPKGSILVGDIITATMLAEVSIKNLAGVVSRRGSTTSHVAILARAFNVPAVMGAADMPIARVDGQPLIVDGYQGRVYISPPDAVTQEYRRLRVEEDELSAELANLKELPAQTTDGFSVHLYANTGLIADVSPALSSGAEGVGLYRTEFPFMIRERFPSEDEQTQIYRQVLTAFAPRPVTLRTLDVGGDKALPYFPIEEENPFLGWRGIRITLDHPEIFLVQVRAMLRANAGIGNMRILLPMITTVDEVDTAIRMIRRAHHELLDNGITIEMPEVGVMVEVPAAVYQVASLAKRADFISVGTNDLSQYLLAVDRNNPRVASLYDCLHPSVIRVLMIIVAACKEAGKPVHICGEMAADPYAVLLLLGMGVDSLSVNAASIPRMKYIIRNFSQANAEEILHLSLEYEHGQSIRHFLHSVLVEHGLDGLVHAGRANIEAMKA